MKRKDLLDLCYFIQSEVKNVRNEFVFNATEGISGILKTNNLGPFDDDKFYEAYIFGIQEEDEGEYSSLLSFSKPLNVRKDNFPFHELVGKHIAKSLNIKFQDNYRDFDLTNSFSKLINLDDLPVDKKIMKDVYSVIDASKKFDNLGSERVVNMINENDDKYK